MSEGATFWLAYTAGQTIFGFFLLGAIVWIVGKFAFTKRSAIDRSRLLPASTWLVMSVIWFIRGTPTLALTTIPSFLLIWAARHFLAKRRDGKTTGL